MEGRDGGERGAEFYLQLLPLEFLLDTHTKPLLRVAPVDKYYDVCSNNRATIQLMGYLWTVTTWNYSSVGK